MESSSSTNKRIAKNTMMLYLRQILILLVNLYAVRVVLDALGVEDFGVYSVVGGIVSLFSFLSGTMSSATQRFFSFFLGQKDFLKLKQVFSVNSIIYLSIAVITLFLLETVGLWFVKEQLRLPDDRFEAAIFVYHFSVFAFIATIIKTPFEAMLIAHEKMNIYAYISIVEAVMKLAVVLLLVYMPGDKLQVYGVLLFCVALINAFLYGGFCVLKFEESQLKRLYWNKTVFREIVGFTGWTLLGQLTTVFRNQGVTILLNQAFSPVVVAARAIASNITNQIILFSNNFNIGLYPPIIKAYASKETEYMFSLIIHGSKITFFLMWVFALPFWIEMETILLIWLKEPPAYAVLFTRLALIEVLIGSVSLPLATAARAPGKMKMYELTLGLIQLGVLIVSWVVLKMGAAAYAVYYVAIAANVLMFILRLYLVGRLIGLPGWLFVKRTILPLSGVVIVSLIATLVFDFLMPQGLIFSGSTVFVSVVVSSTAMFYIGLDAIWRKKVVSVFVHKFNKVFFWHK